jgi:hypothetical protein
MTKTKEGRRKKKNVALKSTYCTIVVGTARSKKRRVQIVEYEALSLEHLGASKSKS